MKADASERQKMAETATPASLPPRSLFHEVSHGLPA